VVMPTFMLRTGDSRPEPVGSDPEGVSPVTDDGVTHDVVGRVAHQEDRKFGDFLVRRFPRV